MKKLLIAALILGMSVSAPAQNEVVNIDLANTNNWVVTPNNLKANTGRVIMNIPAGSKWTVYVYSMADNKYITSFTASNNKGLFALSPGEYKLTINNAPVLNVPVKMGHDTKLETGVLHIPADAVWYLYDKSGKNSYTSGNKAEKLVLPVGKYTITFHNAPIENVQVKKGVDTKLKTGLLDIKDNDVWYLYDESGTTSYTSGNKPEKLVLPVGNYTLSVGGTNRPVVVSEAGVANEIGIDDIEDLEANTYQWVISDLPGKDNMPEVKSKGLLDLNFEGSTNWSMQIKKVGSTESYQISEDNLKINRSSTFSLDPGEYDIKLNAVTIKNVPIKSNKKTRIKVGLISIHYVTPTGPSLPVKTYVYDMNKTYNEYYFMANGPLVKLMPVGTYGLRVWGDWPANSVVIKDKETKELLIVTNTLKIHANAVVWRLCNTDQTVIPCYFFGGNGDYTVYLPLGTYKLWYGNTSVTVVVNSSSQNTVTIPQ